MRSLAGSDDAVYSFKINICIICADYDADIMSAMDAGLLNFH